MNGLLAALLAEKGFTSSTDMLEGDKGFSKVFSTRADQVESIQLDAFSVACDIAGIPTPRTGLEGRFSLAFCVALALGDGDMGEPSFNDQKVKDPRLVALRDKVKIEPDASLSPSRAKIRVLTKDGRALEKSMDTLDLSKDRKKLKQDLTRKFRDL